MNPSSQVPAIVTVLSDFQEILEYTGTVAFAITGAVAAGRKKMDVLGVVVLGCLVAVGGGTVRDLLLGRPVFWIKDPTFVVVAAISALTVVPLARTKALDVLERYRVLAVLGSAAMALFVVIGTNIALVAGANGVAAVIVGVISGVGGGVIRDLVADQVPEVLRNGEIYASAALVGSTVYVVLVEFRASILVAFWIAIAVIFTTRMIAFNARLLLPTFHYVAPGG